MRLRGVLATLVVTFFGTCLFVPTDPQEVPENKAVVDSLLWTAWGRTDTVQYTTITAYEYDSVYFYEEADTAKYMLVWGMLCDDTLYDFGRQGYETGYLIASSDSLKLYNRYRCELSFGDAGTMPAKSLPVSSVEDSLSFVGHYDEKYPIKFAYSFKNVHLSTEYLLNCSPFFITVDGDFNDTINVGADYQDTVRAVDTDGDPLSYVLLSRPAGMEIEDSIIAWVPDTADAGLFPIKLHITDNGLIYDTLSWHLLVNTPPSIDADSVPATLFVTIGLSYIDTVHATDADGDSLVFRFVDSTDGMLLHDSIVTWTPSQQDTGTVTVGIQVIDGLNGYDTVYWALRINHAPVFTVHQSELRNTLTEGMTYQDTIHAMDDDSDAVVFHVLDDSLGVSVSRGVVGWVSTVGDTGTKTIRIQADDGHGGFDTLVWQVLVSDTNYAPVFSRIWSLDRSAIVGTEYRDSAGAVDPDGDPVYFSFLDSSEGMVLVDSNINWVPGPGDTGKHTVKIQASDGSGAHSTVKWDLWVGDSGRFREATSNSGLPYRIEHTALVFGDKMWVIAGNRPHSTTVRSDVWSSTDGTNWDMATDAAAFGKRKGHASLVFGGKMWVMGGGVGNYSYENDVWYSSDGVLWSSATDSAQFEQREHHACVAFDGKMWVLGGRSNGYMADVWYSTDGIGWTQATDSAAFGKRMQHSCVVFNGKMWVIGGGDGFCAGSNDIWCSDDGATWTQAVNSAEFPPVSEHTAVVFDNKMWVIGGSASWLVAYNDVWYSGDGIIWTRDGCSGFLPRGGHSSLVFQDQIWIMSGVHHSQGDPGQTRVQALADVWRR